METIADLPFIGGNPALDFVNTAEDRGHPRAEDALTTVGDLRAWGVRYGILDATATCEGPADELVRAIAARELLYRLWSRRARGGSDDPADLAHLTELAADALGSATPRPGDDGRVSWRFATGDLTSVRHVVVTAAVELLTHTGTARLKQCPGDQCGWFFLDTTKRGNRRWCSMRDCGQAAKTAERRRRTRR